MAADVRTTYTTLNLDWGASAPAGLGVVDWFVGRITCWLLAPSASNYTFALSVDDQARVLVDGEIWLPAGGSRSVLMPLSQGLHLLELHYLEAVGSASVRLRWDGGVQGAVRDGVGAPAALACLTVRQGGDH